MLPVTSFLRTRCPPRRPAGAGWLPAFALLLAATSPVRADTVDALCEIQPRARTAPVLSLPCSFSQRQGYIGIQRSDEVRHDLEPQSAPGRYLDEQKRTVLRQAGLGKRGLIFHFPQETLKVYWQAPQERQPPVLREPAPTAPFQRTLSLQGIGFAVSSANTAGRNSIEIRPRGLAADNAPLVREAEGRITGMEVADLNADGSPELYIYLVGGDGRGQLLAFSANRRRSLSDIALPAFEAAGTAARGWRGHDEFAVVENTLVRRFPVYRSADPDQAPGGGWRQFQYKLARGEASWQLRLDRVVGY